MISKKVILWWLSIILLFPLISNTFAQEEEEEEEEVITEKPMLKANELPEDFRFDGRFNLAEWSAGADSIALSVSEADQI